MPHGCPRTTGQPWATMGNHECPASASNACSEGRHAQVRGRGGGGADRARQWRQAHPGPCLLAGSRWLPDCQLRRPAPPDFLALSRLPDRGDTTVVRTEIGFLIRAYAIPTAWIPVLFASIITGAGHKLTVLLRGRMEHFLNRYACRIRTKT